MANDFLSTVVLNNADIKILSGNISYYLVASEDLSGTSETTPNQHLYIPPVQEVMGCYFIPYLSKTDFSIIETTLKDKYLTYNNNSTLNYATEDDLRKIQRIYKLNTTVKHVATFEPNFVSGKTIGGRFNWRNEGKMWLPPYHYGCISDGISNPINYSLSMIDTTKSSHSIRLRTALNAQGMYQLYIDGYRGDSTGMVYNVVTSGNVLPTSNSAYLNYIANNQNQINAQYMTQMLSAGANVLTSMNPMALVSGVVGMANTAITETAKQADLKGSGFTLNNVGNDTLYKMQQGDVLHLEVFSLKEKELEMIAKQFHLYGYAQNQLMQPTFKGRKYWNYLQTSDCHLKVHNCPKEHLQQLKEIFDNGVTVWHKANGEMFENTEKDNAEL